MERHLGETLGEYLRRERESRTVSLAELSRGTRISPAYLEALERDDFQSIPRKEFILGFLKGYARYLGLNGEEILRRYQFQCELDSREEAFHQLPLFPSAPPPPEEKREPSPPPGLHWQFKNRLNLNIIVQLAVILAAIGLGFYIRHVLRDEPPNNPELAISAGTSANTHEAGAGQGNRTRAHGSN